MFIGQFAVAFAAKRWTPRVSLGALFGAAQLADLLWPALVALGIEQVRIDPGNTVSTPLDFVSYPYSHSLAALVVWSLVLGWVCRRMGLGPRVVGIMCALVISHWVLDVRGHRPDMPLYPGGPKFGLGCGTGRFWRKRSRSRCMAPDYGYIFAPRVRVTASVAGDCSAWRRS